MRVTIIALSILLAGCTTLQDLSPWEVRVKEPDGVVDIAALSEAVDTLRGRYITVRSDVQAKRDDIHPDDWQDLAELNDLMVEADAYVRALRSQANDSETLVMTLKETADVGQPILEASERIPAILDKYMHLMSPVSRVNYVTAREQAEDLRVQISRITESPTPQDRAELYTQMAYLLAAVLGAPVF